MTACFFVSDLHGQPDRYRKLFRAIITDRPSVVFLGGDLLPRLPPGPAGRGSAQAAFVRQFLGRELAGLRDSMGRSFPRVLLILGNDDPRSAEAAILDGGSQGLWEYIHNARVELNGFDVYGYACVPPTPFMLKDWEQYDVSRHVDPGCVSPEEGARTVPVDASHVRFATISKDLARLAADRPLDRAAFLFHTPPHDTALDRAALDGVCVENVQVDVHLGSIAVRRFIESRQPCLTMHGHVHESAALTGRWSERIGRTVMMSAAHDGPELSLIRFDLESPNNATRELL